MTPHLRRALIILALAAFCAVTGICFCGLLLGAEAETPHGEAVESASDLDYSPLPEHYTPIFTKPIGEVEHRDCGCSCGPKCTCTARQNCGSPKCCKRPKPKPKAIELQFVAPDGQVIHSSRAYPQPMNSSCGPGGCYSRPGPRLFRWRGR